MYRGVLLGVCATLLSAGPARATSFTGSISAPDAGGIDTTGGSWLNSTSITLSWTVSSNADGSWHYSYTFTTPTQGALSHLIVEVSNNVTGVDILNLKLNGSAATGSVDTYGPGTQGNSNPNIPGTVYGLKVDSSSSGSSNTIDFDIFRAPTWGDFYAKDGNAGGGTNAAWDTGFVSGETAGLGNDPENVAPHNGPDSSVNGLAHILVPDSSTSAVPEPSSLVLGIFSLAGCGFAGLGRRLRRRRPS